MEEFNAGYINKGHSREFKRYCQKLDLQNDKALIEEYKFWHLPENRWKEIPLGIREVGILDMEIYIHENHLFMIVETPVDFDWDKAFDTLAKLNRQAEWEDFMSKFQISKENASSSEKWQLMERIFKL